jgi:hypothetical protein
MGEVQSAGEKGIGIVQHTDRSRQTLYGQRHLPELVSRITCALSGVFSLAQACLDKNMADGRETARVNFIRRILRRVPISKHDIEFDDVAPRDTAANK